MSIFSRFLSFFYSVKAKIVSKMESENRKFIGVFELLDHLKESENERRKSEILPFDSHLKDEPKQTEMSYIELDKGILLPLKSKPKMRETKTIVGLYDTDSEDEEILFSKEMLNRLRKREAVMKNPQLPTTSAITETIAIDTSCEKSAPVSSSSSSKQQSSVSPPLSDR
ncbi:Centrosomal protein CEP104 N-terminal domain-containing protein [Caenorhabditis elegans]|nr:Uncharacterized protein CELE_C06A8.8 [Caenorhabditis elegans]VAY52112.1 Uncharacterized protein CELE_C06A8.8 [Caenorhabditis elegans]|eukprot:NP_001355402.1 Uncharacterized protein CELE_C06A8.8 [Caenorhabditis elegans]